MAQGQPQGYNGWANRETRSVALAITSYATLTNFYRDFTADIIGHKKETEWTVAICDCWEQTSYNIGKHGQYEKFRSFLRRQGVTETPEEVAYNDSGLDIERLDALLKELLGYPKPSTETGKREPRPALSIKLLTETEKLKIGRRT